LVDKIKVTVPSYTVLAKEEPLITYSQGSAFSDEQHPERLVLKKAPKPIKKKVEEKRYRRGGKR
jgi:ribosomal protein S4